MIYSKMNILKYNRFYLVVEGKEILHATLSFKKSREFYVKREVYANY